MCHPGDQLQERCEAAAETRDGIRFAELPRPPELPDHGEPAQWWFTVAARGNCSTDGNSVWHRMHQQGRPCRFDVGTKVMCNTGRSGWPVGTIVALYYREDRWPPGNVAPYQVQLEDGQLIFVPADDDRTVIAEPLSKTGNRNRRARLAAKACKKAPMNSASDASARMLKTRLLEHGSGGGL